MTSGKDFRKENGGVKDFYEILSRGIDIKEPLGPLSTAAQIRNAYRKQVLKWHPDKHPNDPPDAKATAETMIKAINNAYEVLKNQDTKTLYDGVYEAEKARKGGGVRGAAPSTGQRQTYSPPQSPPRSSDARSGDHSGGRSSGTRIFVNGVEVSREEAARWGIHIGSRTSRSESGLESQISESYEGVRTVRISNEKSSIKLGLSNDGKVYVNGFAAKKPQLSTDGVLSIEDIAGTVLLPRRQSGLYVAARTEVGNIEGDVAHQGTLRAEVGHVKLNIHAPLEVIAEVEVGSGGGRYYPPSGRPTGRLEVKTEVGNVKIAYAGAAATAGSR